MAGQCEGFGCDGQLFKLVEEVVHAVGRKGPGCT